MTNSIDWSYARLLLPTAAQARGVEEATYSMAQYTALSMPALQQAVICCLLCPVEQVTSLQTLGVIFRGMGYELSRLDRFSQQLECATQQNTTVESSAAVIGSTSPSMPQGPVCQISLKLQHLAPLP
jgi:hypothetical protein